MIHTLVPEVRAVHKEVPGETPIGEVDSRIPPVDWNSSDSYLAKAVDMVLVHKGTERYMEDGHTVRGTDEHKLGPCLGEYGGLDLVQVDTTPGRHGALDIQTLALSRRAVSHGKEPWQHLD